MVYYYLYLYTDDAKMLEAAEAADGSYCFPNRLEDIAALEKAVANGGEYAKYYLGCLFYDKGNKKRAQELWESCNISLATLKRNLSLVYYNVLHDKDRALCAMEEAFAADRSDARVFFELDRLYKSLNFSLDVRLRKMNENAELLEMRDDLYTEYITLLNLNGEYENAYKRIMSHSFHPWEGGEGKIPAQYRIALINMARTAERERATEYLERALSYPENLGEGKLIGNTDSDIYYMLGMLYEDKEKSEQAYRLAARGEFNLSSAMYYNDQPPKMLYYAAKATEALGKKAEAESRFREFIKYGEAHYNDDVKIDYFAVSLPDFLVFEGDLNSKNRVHCCLMQALGYLGLNKKAEAETAAKLGLSEDCTNAELLEVLAQI